MEPRSWLILGGRANVGGHSMATLHYPYARHPEPGSTLEIAPGVRWITMPMGGSLNHINLYLLEDTHGWWVVDTGLALPEIRELWHRVFDSALGGKPVVGVICTHMHPDHVGQSKMITDHFQCPLYMTRAEYYQARAFSGGGSPHSSWASREFYLRAGMPGEYLDELRRQWEQRSSDGMSMPEMPGGYRRLQHGDILHIGGREWQVVIGSGHSPEHACLYSASLKVFLSGDQILPVITSNVSVHPTEPEANPLKDWMQSLDELLALPSDLLVLPAHNLPFTGVRERLRSLLSHHEDRMLAIEEHCTKPALARDLLPVLFTRRLDPRQMMMALGEAIAHLHLLMHRNRIERTLHEDGHYRFRSIDPDLARRAHPGDHEAPSESPVLV